MMQSPGTAPALLLLALTLGCGTETTSPPGGTAELMLPSAIDLDRGEVIESLVPLAGGEFEIYERSGAPWFASTPGIEVVSHGTQSVTAQACTQTTDWSYYESPVEALSFTTYFCVKTSEGRVGRVRVDRRNGVADRVGVTYGLAW